MEHKQLEFPLALGVLAEDGVFSGYASIFDVTDSHNDIIVKGAFANTLSEKGTDIKLLWQHQPHAPIGIVTAIKEDARGLYVEGRLLLDVQRGQEAWSLLKSGAINGLSIGYRAVKHHYDAATGTRLLTEIELFEISLVTFPANAHAGVTKLKHALPETIREFEHFLRDAGFSRHQAKSIASEGFRVAAELEDEREVLSSALERAAKALIL